MHLLPKRRNELFRKLVSRAAELTNADPPQEVDSTERHGE